LGLTTGLDTVVTSQTGGWLGLTTGLDTVVTSPLYRRLVGPQNRVGHCGDKSLYRRLVGPQNRVGHCGDKSVRQDAGWASQQAWTLW